jgi:tyrosinase
MTATRRDIWELETDEQGWCETTLWYARGVAELQKRPLAQRTSWRFLAAMHNFDKDMWRDAGYLADDDAYPVQADIDQFWARCQHWNWYFLPWHRGYLAAFEQLIRAAIAPLGGPADWALPYWNYNNPRIPHPHQIPPCFRETHLPDGGENPLYIEARYGLDAQGHMKNVDPKRISDREALLEADFEGAGQGGAAGFGGTPGDIGQVEMSPHNHAHTRIGGVEPAGLMSATETAGLDPIFWLHHANIDRLWEVWLKRDPAHGNSDDVDWLDGPPAPEPPFYMPGADGSAWRFVARQMLDTRAPQLDYVYDNTDDPVQGEDRREQRLLKLGLPSRRVRGVAESVGGDDMKPKPTVELIGANDEVLRLEGLETDTAVELDDRGARRLRRSFDKGLLLEGVGEVAAPDRVFLNLENVRGRRDAMVLDIYLNLPAGAVPAEHPQARVGSLSLFGLRMASRGDGTHAGNGLNLRLEITDYIDAHGIDRLTGLGDLRVKVVAEAAVKPEDEISIGRVSLYRQAG